MVTSVTHLYKRTGDSVIVQIYRQLSGGTLPGGVVAKGGDLVEFDGGKYTVITQAAFEANYVPQGPDKKLAGR